MKTVRDRNLPRPFSDWIDPAVPLPADVQLLKRARKWYDELLLLLTLGTPFGGMGFVWAAILVRTFNPQQDEPWALLLMASVAAACLAVPISLGLRLGATLAAARADRAGRLRLGIFVGPEGLVWRLAANRCRVVPWDQFVDARQAPPPVSIDDATPRLVLETLDGNLEARADAVEASPETLRQAAARRRPGWAPPPPERADRERRLDPRGARDQLRLAGWFVAALVAVVFTAIGGAGQPGDAWSTGLFWLGAALLGASGANFVRTMARVVKPFACPQCGKPELRRIEGALPSIRCYCPQCNVEWDTGLKLSTGD